MKYIRCISFLLLSLFVSLVHAKIFDEPVVNLQTQNQAAIDDGKVLVVLMTMPDCPNCEYMEKNVFSNKPFQEQFNKKFRSVRLDITANSILVDTNGKETSPNALAKRLRVYGSPSFVFYDDKGGVIYRYTGKLDLSGFKKLMNYVNSGQYEIKPFQVSSLGPRGVEEMIAGDICTTQKTKAIP